MEQRELLIDAFGRINGIVHRVVEGASSELLSYRVDPDANTIAWLVWHLTRGEDSQVTDVAGTQQLWLTEWADRFALPLPRSSTGYGHSSSDVASVTASPEDLLGYHDAVHGATVAYLETLSGEDLDRVVDTSWDPPVTLGARLVSVVGDDWQHAGQASFVKGIAGRAGVK
ncbi:DinB family protein [Gryllotalpicola reticulitermitis]|uniref:DinB family protein n=1 Tax=Gryllotalpicola reticulitermitis TaxID=1184153 RepID=A0ABV8Q6C8_9MICO